MNVMQYHTHNGNNIFHLAVMNRQIDIIKLLLKCGANVDTMTNDEWKWTPLHLTAQYRATTICQLLIENGANVNTLDVLQRTPLHYAVQEKGNLKLVRILLENGADIDALDEDRWTPLHHAILYTDLFTENKIINLLIKNGANLNIVDKDGWTPLELATRNGHKKIAKLLIENGAKE